MPRNVLKIKCVNEINLEWLNLLDPRMRKKKSGVKKFLAQRSPALSK